MKLTLKQITLVTLISTLHTTGCAHENTIEIYKSDESKQCAYNSGIPLNKMERTLKANGIKVVSSRKGKDGLIYTTVCGANTGTINIYIIPEKQMNKAKSIGFQPL